MSEAEVIQDQSEYELDTSWMDQMGEWGMHAEPGKRGLTLEEIRIAPKLSDISVELFGLAWLPYRKTEQGRFVPDWSDAG